MKKIIKGINILITVLLILNIVSVFLLNIHFLTLGVVISNTDNLTPDIKVKDIVIYKSKNDYKENDIIVYNITNKYYMAKVSSREEYLTYIKDNTDTVYNPISNADIKGSPLVVFPSYFIYIYLLINIIILIYLISVILINVKKMYEEEKNI